VWQVWEIATNTNINWLALKDGWRDGSVNQLLCIIQMLNNNLQMEFHNLLQFRLKSMTLQRKWQQQ
jgi:hypothetical protein